jgi:ABC-type antimicrobial peptide transport system permease subunit
LCQTLTETILLALIGGVIGAWLATYGTRVVASYAPDEVRLLADTRFNMPFLVFSIAVTLATGMACGIVPAWQTYRRDPGVELKDAGRATASGTRADG